MALTVYILPGVPPSRRNWIVFQLIVANPDTRFTGVVTTDTTFVIVSSGSDLSRKSMSNNKLSVEYLIST